MSTNTTTNYTVPAGWQQIVLPFGSGTNVSTATFNGTTVTTDISSFGRNLGFAYNSVAKTQIDDYIGSIKTTTNGASSWVFHHHVDWDTTSTLAQGNVLSMWIQYQNWDGSAVGTQSYLNVQTLATVGSGALSVSNVFSNTVGTLDLNSLANVTATNVKGSATAAGFVSPVPQVIGVFTPVNSAGWTTYQFGAMEFGNTTSSVKVGNTVNYKVGWKLFPSATSTTPTTSGVSSTQTWTLVDGASIITATSFAAALAMLSF